jgi:hypothetical protein
MKLYKKILFIFACAIILSNIPPFYNFFNLFLDERHYLYSNYNGSLTFSEFMSRDFEMFKRRHEGCNLVRPNLKDKQIYRLFSKKPLAFWRWGRYFFGERYKLPYKDFEEIKKLEKENMLKL